MIALLGAFIFAELGRRRPQVGGGYAYLRDAFGPLPAFLYGWALLLVIATGAIAAVAMTFASYAAPLVGLGAGARRRSRSGAVVLLSVVNVVGVEPGAATQNVFTVLKLLALAALLAAALLAPAGALPSLPTPIAAVPLVAADRACGDAARGEHGARAGAVLVRRLAADELRGRGAARPGAHAAARARPRRA